MRALEQQVIAPGTVNARLAAGEPDVLEPGAKGDGFAPRFVKCMTIDGDGKALAAASHASLGQRAAASPRAAQQVWLRQRARDGSLCADTLTVAMLVGRSLERAAVDSLLDATRDGRSTALLLLGEPGIGKSAVLEYAIASAAGLRLLRGQGFESERTLPYAGLSRLLSPVLDRVADLPGPQRGALETALALRSPSPVDRFAAYAGTLRLLACVAEDTPLLVMVDDLHWLDEASAQALMFAARRLQDDRVGMLFAARDGHAGQADGRGVAELTIGGLDVQEAAELLCTIARRAVSSSVIARLAQATRGNPLALVELATVLTRAQLVGASPIDEPIPVGVNITAIFGGRIEALPEATRRALTLAAADDGIPIATLGRALRGIGLAINTLEPAEAIHLLTVDGGTARFGHPLIRAAAYHRATSPARRAAHRALAAALDQPADRGRRAWHLACATVEPDEAISQELDAVAAEARARGAPAAAASALEASVRLSAPGGLRTRRLLQGAQDYYTAGAPDAAGVMLDDALASAGDNAPLRAQIQHARIRGELLRSPPAESRALLKGEAHRVGVIDTAVATAMLIDAAFLASMEGQSGIALEEIREVAADAEDVGGETALLARWVLGTAELQAGDYSQGRVIIENAEHAIRARPLAAGPIAIALGQCLGWIEEFERSYSLHAHIVAEARREGVVMTLPFALASLAEAESRLGRWSAAYAHATESLALATDIGMANELSNSHMRLAQIEAGRGREASCRDHAERSLALAETLGIGSIATIAASAVGLLELGLGRFAAAVERLEPAGAFALDVGLADPGVVPWAQDLAEAHIRLGDHAKAQQVLDVLEGQATRTGARLANAALSRCRGLLADGEDFDAHFGRALTLHQQRPAPFEQARTHLCFGEQLRRAGRRTESREQLHRARSMFDHLDAQPWADRAIRELRASGERARRRVADTADQLTPQELQVALIAAGGATNQETATALFISPKTVETHLNRVYRKLGLRSRVELARALPGIAATAKRSAGD